MKQYHSVRIGREVNGLLQDVADAVGKSKRRIIDALARFAARQPVGFIERILDDAESQGDKEGRAER